MTMHFLAECLATPWALQPERIRAYAGLLAERYFHGRRPEPSAAPFGPREGFEASSARRVGSAKQGVIAVIPVLGTIMQRASSFDLCEGGTSTQGVSQALKAANDDDSVSSILLDIDSPGGSVYGVAELAAEIRASGKPVTAIANSLAASAAYWIGTAAKEFFVTPGGEAGSIGVWMAHEDWSQALKDAGIDVTLISAGKYKVEGNPYGPLDAAAREFLQSRTDDYYAAFTRDVAKGRKVSVDDVRGGMGQGRVLGASQAVEEKMVDGVKTFDQVVRHMQQSMKAPAGAAKGTSSSLAAAQRRIAIAQLES